MKSYRTVLTILSMILAKPAFASKACISDIYSAAVEIKSVKYRLYENDSSYATISPTDVGGAKISKIWYCPDSGTEYITYLRFSRLEFHDRSSPVYDNIPQNVSLFSGGLEFKRAFAKKWEWMIDFSLRRELGFSGDDSGIGVHSHSYLNLGAQGGLRAFVLKGNRFDLSLVGKYGWLASSKDEVESGTTLTLEFETLVRMARMWSLKLDLYLDSYSQQYEKLENQKSESGARANVIFRL